MKKKDQQAAITHLQRMQEIKESEQQQRCHIPMAEYERRSKIQRQTIEYALSEKGKKPRPIKIPPTEPQRPDHSKNVTPDPDYLDLVPMKPQSHSSDETKEPKSKRWTPEEEKVKDNKPSDVPTKPLQIKGNKRLPIEGPKTYAPKSDPKRTPGQKQVVPYKPVWPDRGIKRELVHPLGGNTIPIKYSKDIGRNGGIERPTSTEALKSQNSALKAVKQFFHNGEESPQRSPSEHSHPEDLAWDYQGEGLRNTKPTPPQDVTPDIVSETKNGNILSDPFEKLRGTVTKQIQNRRGVITLPQPIRPKIYKRKTGELGGKIYSDEGIYGDERDELWAKGDSGSSDQPELFDLYCLKCQGDHLTIFCPIGEEGRQYNGRGTSRFTKEDVRKILRRECNICGELDGRHSRVCSYKNQTGCWDCGGQHYQKNCHRAALRRELETARKHSEDLHAELLYNQGGANRINALTRQQRKEIQKTQPTPHPESSTKEPFEKVRVKKRKVGDEGDDDNLFKKPADGMRAPRKLPLKEEKVQEWVEEQNRINLTPRHTPSEHIIQTKEPRREETKPHMRTPSPKEQRRPRKQPHPKRAVPIEEEMRGEEQQEYHKSTSSQVRIGSLENLSQNVEELPSLPQPFVAEQRQILTE